MRITRKIADDVAKKMSEYKYGSLIEKLKSERLRIGDRIAEDYIPAYIINASKTYPDFFDIKDTIYIVSEGYYGMHIHTNRMNPIPRCAIKVSNEEFMAIRDINENIARIISEKESLFSRISDTIFALHTFEKVKIEFPESIKYIDCSKEKQLPALKIDDLRNLFK